MQDLFSFPNRYCLGCKVFGALMEVGLVPEAVCAECADISLRVHSAAPTG